jgi:hypothetical protein
MARCWQRFTPAKTLKEGVSGPAVKKKLAAKPKAVAAKNRQEELIQALRIIRKFAKPALEAKAD